MMHYMFLLHTAGRKKVKKNVSNLHFMFSHLFGSKCTRSK